MSERREGDERIEALLASVEVPSESEERAARWIRAALLGRRNRRRIGGLAAIAVALTIGVTAPGQAAIEWVGGLFTLEESESESDPPTPVGRGVLPSGESYQVSAFLNGRRAERCVDITLQPEEPDTLEGRVGGVGFCNFDQWLKDPLERVIYLSPFREEGVMAVGPATGEVADVEVRYTSTSGDRDQSAEVDFFPIAGDVETIDGELEPFGPLNILVAFLPPGVGEFGTMAEAEAIAYDQAGDEIDRLPLQWAAVGLEPGPRVGGVPDTSALGVLTDCVEDRKVCERFASGELGRVERSLTRPLPAELEAALRERGYSFTPATDADREVPVDAGIDLFRQVAERLDGRVGLTYQRLGRVSGNGYEDRLVFVSHLFSVKRKYKSGGGYTDADSLDRELDPFEPRAFTWLLDAESGELLERVSYPAGVET